MELLHEIDAGHGPVGAVAFSPDGQAILTGGGDCVIRIRSTGTMQANAELTGHQNSITCLTFSPDGTRFVSGSVDATIRLWEYPSGTLVATMMGHEETVSDLNFSPDGSQIVSASFDKTARLWSAEHAAEVGIRMKHHKNVSAALFSPDGGALVTAGMGEQIYLWLLPTGSWAAFLRTSQATDVHRVAVGALEMSPSGEVMASAGWDGTVAFWSFPGWAHMRTARIESSGIHALSFHPNSRYLAACSENEVIIVDVETGAKVTSSKQVARGINSVRFSPAGNLVAAGSNDGTLRVWKINL